MTYWREIGEDVLHKKRFLCGPAQKKEMKKENVDFSAFL